MTTRLLPSPGSPRAALFVVNALALALAATFVAPLGAQTAPPGPENALAGETVVLPEFQVSAIHDKGYRAGNSVSATRIDTPIKDLPFSVSAFTDQFISDIGARELPDIVLFAPGVTSGAKEFVAGNTRFSIRGFDSDVQPQRNGFVGNRYVDTANVTRVEVVKGPASLLYGQIMPGGTVNYITKRPTPKPFASIKQEVGTDSFLRTEFDANVPLNSAFGTRLVAAYENGFNYAETGNSKSWLVAPSAIVNLTKNASLTLDYEWAHTNETPLVGMMPNTQITGFSGAPSAANFPNLSARSREQALIDVGALNVGFLAVPPLYREFNYVNNADYRKSDFESFNAEFNIRLNDHWTARANFNYNKWRINNKLTGLGQWDILPTAAYRSTTLSLLDYLSAYLANPAAVLADSTKTSTVTISRRKRLQESWAKSNAYQAEAVGKYEVGGMKLRPLVGAYQLYTTGGGRTATSPVTAYFPIWNYFDHATWDKTGDYDERSLPLDSGYNITKSQDTAYYGVLMASMFNDRLTAVAGTRYNKTKSDTYNMNAGGVLSNTYETTKTTPQYGVGYHATKDLLLFASYSQSFLVEARTLNRPNPAYDPTKNLNAVTNPNQITVPAVPTTGEGYEAGIKTDFFSGRVSSTLSVFHLERANRVLSVRQNVPGLSTTGTPSSQELTFTSQATVDQSEGVEFEITYSPIDNWQIYATTAVMDIKTTEFAAPPLRAATDPLVSGDYNAYLAGYAEAISLIKSAVPEGSAERLASLWTRYTFNEGTLKNLWIAGGGTYTSPKAQRTANPALFFDSYVLLDAAIGYDFKVRNTDCSVVLNAKNLSNKEYYPANQERGLPRRFILSLTARF